MRSRQLKRAIDLLVAAAVLVVAAPLLLAVALLVRLALGRPIFFHQSRAGRGGVPFTLIKFRTMVEATGADGRPLSDAQRLTRVGKWLRRTSLDELPQLLNVLTGRMSLVGPRPLLLRYVTRYTSEQAHRHEVPPGITGWAQVNGRNAICWEEKFQLDVWYVANWSLLLDAHIVLLTLRQLVQREGIGHAGEATMPEFLGTLADTMAETDATVSNRKAA